MGTEADEKGRKIIVSKVSGAGPLRNREHQAGNSAKWPGTLLHQCWQNTFPAPPAPAHPGRGCITGQAAEKQGEITLWWSVLDSQAFGCKCQRYLIKSDFGKLKNGNFFEKFL